MTALGGLAFLQPWILLGLLSLPIIWLLIRITPPAPKSVSFPAIRLLYALQAKEEQPDTTPWWLLLLRLLFAAILILGLARPVLNPDVETSGTGPMVLIIDDSWAAGQDWTIRMEAAERALQRAARDDRPAILVTTAPTDAATPPASELLPARELSRRLGALTPKPWTVDRLAAADSLSERLGRGPAEVIWIHDGVATTEEADNALLRVGAELGPVSVVLDRGASPKRMTPPSAGGRELAVRIDRLRSGVEETVSIRARAADGRILAQEPATFGLQDTETSVTISLPIELRNEITRLDVEGEGSAASVALLDDRFTRRPVGLVADTSYAESQVLLDALYYLERALSPFSEVRRGPVEGFYDGSTSMIVMADAGLLPSDDQDRLERWIESGGVLVRFAGPSLAAVGIDRQTANAEQLVPVRLRRGNRSLGGALSWSKPLAMSAFEAPSPFVGITGYGDVSVNRQVLAEPSIDLAEKTWARLTDGTPIVTAEPRGDGWLVLFHTTADTEWTNLPLSGMFVEMLRRLTEMSAGVDTGIGEETALPPLLSLDGFGRLGDPAATADALRGETLQAGGVLEIGPRLPPGYYGTQITRRAVNLGPALASIEPAGSFTNALSDVANASIEERSLIGGREVELWPWALAAALALFLIDMAVSFGMRGLLTPRAGASTAAAVAMLIAFGGTPSPVAAQGDTRPAAGSDAFAIDAARDPRLAYVITGIPDVDRASESGLAGLSEVLLRRTAIEPAPPIGIDPARDELAFFALLFWPISAEQPPISVEAVEKLNAFMRNGGTILFDTRDQFEATLSGAGSGLQRLRQIAGALDIPPLAPVPDDHVLTKSFYLLGDFPGRYAGGRVWIEEASDTRNGEVTSVIIGSNDWLGAWARTQEGLPAYPVVPGGELQREMAFRFGVNLVMYALTGNYKADQVHVPDILERLGQ